MYAMGKAVLQLREKGEPDGFLYSDEALFTKDIKKPMVGHFKPDYAPDYLLCCNYICHLAVFKRALYEQLGGERPECDGSQDHDLFLRLIEQTGGAAHLPQVLYYWRVHAGSTSGGTDAKPYVAAAAKKRHWTDRSEPHRAHRHGGGRAFPQHLPGQVGHRGRPKGEHPHPQQRPHRRPREVPVQHLVKDRVGQLRGHRHREQLHRPGHLCLL